MLMGVAAPLKLSGQLADIKCYFVASLCNRRNFLSSHVRVFGCSEFAAEVKTPFARTDRADRCEDRHRIDELLAAAAAATGATCVFDALSERVDSDCHQCRYVVFGCFTTSNKLPVLNHPEILFVRTALNVQRTRVAARRTSFRQLKSCGAKDRALDLIVDRCGKELIDSLQIDDRGVCFALRLFFLQAALRVLPDDLLPADRTS